MAGSLPPLEKAEAVRTRSWIIYSFWAVVLFLGLPTWWQTTSIPRTALPTDDMLNWSNQPETRPIYTVPIRIAASDLSCETASQILAQAESIMNKDTSPWGFEVAIQHVRFTSLGSKLQRHSDSRCTVEEVIPEVRSTTIDIELTPGTTFRLDMSSSTTPTVATYLSEESDRLPSLLAESLRRVLAEEQATVAYQYHSQGISNVNLSRYIGHMPGEMTSLVHDNVARAFKPSPDYHITFSLFTPGGFPSSWDIQPALNQHIEPLLHMMSVSTNVSIATQLQLYSSLSPSIQPFQKETSTGWYLRESDLTAFVNTAEWPLSPSVGSGPTINFVLYIPSKQQTPLRIEGTDETGVLGGSWIVPQWGGIAILNAPIVRNDPEVSREDVIAHLTVAALRPAFEVFQTQLLLLLGVPRLPSMSLPLRLKAFQRLSALSLHLRTSSNLGSLARLAQHLNNIPIPRHVSELVDSAMDNLKAYRAGKSHAPAIAAANDGYKASEKAFFDKAMVGQVYFPDEHKVAVYLPLLGPIGVPLIVGLLRELKALKGRLKS